MVQVESYTAKAPGIPFDRIEVCPRCGRTGIERNLAEGRVCVHAESLEMMPDGLLIAPVDFCPIGLLSPSASLNPAFI
jgi:hypothetical protein